MHLSANGNYMKGARMHRLGNTLKRAVAVGAVLALTLGMATPATMSFADDAAGGVPIVLSTGKCSPCDRIAAC